MKWHFKCMCAGVLSAALALSSPVAAYAAGPASERLDSSPSPTDASELPDIMAPGQSGWYKVDDDTWAYDFYVNSTDKDFYYWEGSYGEAPSDYENQVDKPSEEGSKTGIITAQDTDKTGTVTNFKDGVEEPVYGSIVLNKAVPGEDAPERTFVFKIVLSGDQINGVQIFGNTVFTDGKATVILKAGESVSFTDIPSGTAYTVTEDPTANFDPSVNGNPQDAVSGTVGENTAEQVEFTNTYTPPEVETVDLLLMKMVDTNSDSENEDYTFHVFLDGLTGYGEYTMVTGDVTSPSTETFQADADGNLSIDLTLKDGQRALFQALDVGSHYRILEDAGDYTASFVITDEANNGLIATSKRNNTEENKELATDLETADSGEAVSVIFTNKKVLTQSLRVKKIVENAPEGSDISYPVDIEFSGLIPGAAFNSTIGRVFADDTGKYQATFYLKDGGEAVFEGIPVGAVYQLTEHGNAARASYKIEDAGETNGTKIVKAEDENPASQTDLSTQKEKVDEKEDITVTFMNTYTVFPVAVTKVEEIGDNKDTVKISGAKLQILGPDGNIVATNKGELAWTSSLFGTWDLTGRIGLGTVYTLHEEQAPLGYQIADDIRFKIVENPDGSFSCLDENDDPLSGVSVADDGTILITMVDILNINMATLPNTGGQGTIAFYIIGILIIAAAVIIVVVKRKRK